MTYDTYEDSVHDSEPVELYTITIGSTVYRLTSTSDDYTGPSGFEYTATAGLRRNSVSGGGPDTRRDFLTIEIPGDHAIPEQYINNVPGSLTEVTIDRVQRQDGDEESIQIFSGRISAVAFEQSGRRAKLRVEPLITAQSKTVPTITYQSSCNRVLYDSGCGISDSDPSYVLSGAAVTAVDGNTITVTGASGFGDGFFTGGFVESDGASERRMVLDHTGDVLTMLLAFGSSPLGADVTVYAGCDKSINDCRDKFGNNTANFQGFAWIPTKNPFETGIQVGGDS